MEQDLLRHILDVSRQMAETRDLDLLLNYVMDQAIHLAGAERGYVVLVQPDGVPGSVLDLRVRRGPNGQDLADAEDQVSRSILRQVVESSEPLILRDAMQDPRFSEAESVIILRLRSIMCVPLISRGDTIGAIYVENRSIRGRFHQDDVIPLVLFANQAAVATENARLFQSLQRSHDELERRVEERTRELLQANARLKREIAERMQAEEGQSKALAEALQATHALQESEERFRSLFETMMEGVVLIAPDGQIVEANPAAEIILGLSRSEIKTRSYVAPEWEILRLDGTPMPAEEMAGPRAMRGKRPVKEVVMGVKRPDGSVSWVNVSATPQIGKDGKLEGVVSTFVDITERKQAEEAIHQLYEQTRRDAETKSMLLREVNHRVKNNLTSIIGLIQTEQRYGSAEGRDVVEAAMERLVQRINGLAEVHDILSQSGWAPVPLSDLADRMMSAALNVLPLDQLVFVDVTPSEVKVSPRQAGNLALVLNELVTNTVKHAAPGQAATHVAVQIGSEGNGTVRLEYRDDGPGYPEDVLHLKRRGVGLYLIQNLVDHALGGWLALANDDGAMTTVRFESEESSTT